MTPLTENTLRRAPVVLPIHDQDDPEARRIASVIEAQELPSYVRQIRLKLGVDWTGDPDMTLHVILNDEAFDPKHPLDSTDPIHRQLADVLYKEGGGRFPIILFRTVAGQAWAEKEAKRLGLRAWA